jgi:hypothetical protein
MGVEVVWRDAQGRELDVVFDSSNHFARAITQVQNSRREDLPTVHAIDLYADAMIMQPVTESLVHELEILRAETADPGARVHLSNLIRLARSAASAPGSYLDCRGD